jgi:hypothetical protein
VVNLPESYLFHHGNRLTAAVAGAAVYQIGFVPVQLPKPRSEIFGIKIDTDSAWQMSCLIFLQCADIQNEKIGILFIFQDQFIRLLRRDIFEKPVFVFRSPGIAASRVNKNKKK